MEKKKKKKEELRSWSYYIKSILVVVDRRKFLVASINCKDYRCRLKLRRITNNNNNNVRRRRRKRRKKEKKT